MEKEEKEEDEGNVAEGIQQQEAVGGERRKEKWETNCFFFLHFPVKEGLVLTVLDSERETESQKYSDWLIDRLSREDR